MLRNLAAAVALFLFSQTALGLGLGTLKQSSALNEPFDGRIEILGATGQDFDTILIKLADSTQFERAGIKRDAVLLGLKFKLVDGASGSDYIKITSHEPIREPFLNFLLELTWAKGRMIREYTVLLDPPLYDPSPRRVQATPTPAPVTPVAPSPAPVPAPFVEPTPVPVAPAPVVATVEAEPLPTPAPAPSAYIADTTIEVQRNDTLWGIASANRPTSDVSVQQMMLALLRTNPDAFGDNNINVLKRGAILRMPQDGELHVLSRREAIAEVQRQNELWSGYRDAAVADVADVPMGTQDDEVATPADELEAILNEADQAPADGPDPRLELVAPGDEADSVSAGAADEGTSDITLAREELDAQVQENAELQARIAEANEIIDLMSRQVDIRDDELAAMQARLAELGIEAPADVTARAEANLEDASDEVASEEDTTEDGQVAGTEDPIDEGDAADIDISLGAEDDPVSTPTDAEEIAVVPEDPEPVVPDEEIGDVADSSGSMLDGLIPASFSDMVPGGAKTILGILGVLGLGILALLFKLISGGGSAEVVAEEAPSVVAEVASEEDPTSTIDEDTDVSLDLDATIAEPDTIDASEFGSEDTTEFDPEVEQTTPDLQQTLDAGIDDSVEEPGEDPLEEVNVYLAYERFDQAEELVRKVIAEHPDEHKYKLRLLEVFYSSNNKAEYEQAAHSLHEAVGENDGLWESAVAMWTEMSPERALFAEGGIDAAAVPGDAESAFVDITGEEDTGGGGSTMSMSPGDDSALDNTLVGLNDPREITGDGVLDFDLSGTGGEVADNDILDLTATTDALTSGDEVFDLTAGVDDIGDAASDVFDITSEGGIATVSEKGDDLLGASVTNDLGDTGAVLDLTAPRGDDAEDPLDITQTELLNTGQYDDALGTTSPGVDERDDDSMEQTVDFDISDTVGPIEDTVAVTGQDDESVFDLTTPIPAAEADALDFDIGELEDTSSPLDSDDETLDISGGLDFDTDDETISDDVDLDLEIAGASTEDKLDAFEMDVMNADTIGDTTPMDEPPGVADDDVEFDLSLQGSELDDLSIGADTFGGDEQPPVSDPESEIEFDLGLEDTTEIDRLSIDDTLELPAGEAPDESLEALTKSMEESMAGLDLNDGDLEDLDGELDLTLADTSSGLDIDFSDTQAKAGTSLDFDLDGLDLDGPEEEESTLALDVSGDADTPVEQSTLAMPVEDTVEQQSQAEEVDTKLNLAKAYIELGDKDGARSILDEVARDGTVEQKGEATKLIEQLD